MSLQDQELMRAPSCAPGFCVICGRSQHTSHHVVPRSRGGHKGPVVHLCGHGTAGHHGMAEDKKLHFRYTDRWFYLITKQATKYQDALELEGWRPLS